MSKETKNSQREAADITFTNQEVSDILYCYEVSKKENELITHQLKKDNSISKSNLAELNDFLYHESLGFVNTDEPEDIRWQDSIEGIMLYVNTCDKIYNTYPSIEDVKEFMNIESYEKSKSTVNAFKKEDDLMCGEIDYLSSEGNVLYSMKYLDIDVFEKDVKECLNNNDSINVRYFSKQNMGSKAVIKSTADDCKEIAVSNSFILKKCRENTNLTSNELASKIGVIPKRILEWENGISNPDLSTFKRALTVLKYEAVKSWQEKQNQKNYRVLISEKQNGYVEVNAETEEEAKEKALEEYDKGNVFWNKSEITEVKLENSTLQLGNSKPYEFKLNPNESTTYVILEKNKNCALIKRFISESVSDPSPYIIAYGLEKKEDNLIEWDRGSYYKDLSGAVEEYSDYTKSLKTDKSLIGEIDFLSSDGKVAYTIKYNDINIFEKVVIDCLDKGVSINYSNSSDAYSHTITKSDKIIGEISVLNKNDGKVDYIKYYTNVESFNKDVESFSHKKLINVSDRLNQEMYDNYEADYSEGKLCGIKICDDFVEKPKEEKPIGEIDYISPSGKVAYTTKYSDIAAFKKDITECLNDGVPIEVRDYSKQNIYSNAVADMYGYDAAEEIEKKKWEQEQIEKAIAEQEKKLVIRHDDNVSECSLDEDEQNEFEEDDEMEM